MRLALIGSGSFIAKQVHDAAKAVGIEVSSFSHDADLAGALKGADVVINFSLNPEIHRKPYNMAMDCDLNVARAAYRSGARFIMLSSRRVYPAGTRWGAREADLATGDETTYGQNKAFSERAITAEIGNHLTILRLSNIVGFEYEPDRQRRTFMGMVLRRLRIDGEISFDMSSDTGRDFLPVEACAGAIVRVAQAGTSGVFNIGAGFALSCGDIANAVLRGFGAGKLVVTNGAKRDDFYLNTERWTSAFGALTSRTELLEYCENLGRRLKNA